MCDGDTWFFAEHGYDRPDPIPSSIFIAQYEPNFATERHKPSEIFTGHKYIGGKASHDRAKTKKEYKFFSTLCSPGKSKIKLHF